MILIYKICPSAMWWEAQQSGMFRGSPVDQRDGFVHFSTAEQAADTAAKHFAGERDLVLLTVESASLGDALKWEPSRGGVLFPHFYGALDIRAVINVAALPLGQDGRHVFPPMPRHENRGE